MKSNKEENTKVKSSNIINSNYKEEETTKSNICSNDLVKSKSEIISSNTSPKNIGKINLNSNTTIKNTVSNEEGNIQMVNRLDEIHKKYKHMFDLEDSSDFESIIENLRSNLNE